MALNAHEMIALNAYGRNDFEGLWLWMPLKEMTLNSYENGGSECLWRKWIWTPMKIGALNANGKNDPERLWLWMPMKEMALNA